MTEFQREVYEYLQLFFEHNERYPSLKEIQEAFQLSSRSQGQAVMNRLKKQNLVTWQPGIPGTVQLIGHQTESEIIED